MNRTILRYSTSLLLLAFLGCGASNVNTSDAKPAGTTSNPGPSGPKLPSCNDGSCFNCGDGICLNGFYCETNGAVTGCASNASCAKKPNCECLRPSLSKDPRCKCEDRNGIAFVTCGS